jgi:Ca-activated chloride channel family protein
MIGFANSHYMIPIVSGAVFLVLVYMTYILWKGHILGTLSSRGANPEKLLRGSVLARRVKPVLVILAIVLFALTLLRPQWGERSREVASEGTDVLVLLDVSRSMLARDVEPSRLERSKSAVRWIARSLKGDRIGMILFAGDAFLQCPLTRDIGAFMMFLDAAGPDALSRQGTDIGRALDRAQKVFQKKRMTSRMLVLITDGEDHEGALMEQARRFREMDVSIYTVGVGRTGGSGIPASDAPEDTDLFVKDKTGRSVRTRKNESLLKKIAAVTRGSYLDITRDLSDLKFLLEIIEDQQTREYDSRIVKEPKERFYIPAILLVLVLVAEAALPERPLPGKVAGNDRKKNREKVS